MKALCLLPIVLLTVRVYSQIIPSTIGEIYNFEPGDSFEYQRQVVSLGNSIGCILTGYDLIVVQSKLLRNDSVIYQVNSIHTSSWHCNYQNGGTNSGSGPATLIYTMLDSSIFWKLWNHTHSPYPCDTITSFCHFDSVYSDLLMHSRKVNKHWAGIQGWYETDTSYAEGLGLIRGSNANEDIGFQQGDYTLIYYHKANGEKWGYPHYFIVTGGDELTDKMPDIIIAPNPVVSEFHVLLPGHVTNPLRFNLYDSLGRRVMNSKIQNVATIINRENLKPGIYFWEIDEEGKSQRGKLFLL